MHDPLVRSIADTARWVAYHRAEESERPDALFSDPYARKLAGERGELIGKQMNNAMYIAIRTVLFDTLILEQLARAPIDMVVNLAAGLDFTRLSSEAATELAMGRNRPARNCRYQKDRPRRRTDQLHAQCRCSGLGRGAASTALV